MWNTLFVCFNLITDWATLNSNNCIQALVIIGKESFAALRRNFGPLIFADQIQPHWRVFKIPVRGWLTRPLDNKHLQLETPCCVYLRYLCLIFKFVWWDDVKNIQRKEKSKSGRGQRFYAVDHRDETVFCTGFLIHKDIKMAGTTALRSHKGLHYKIHKHNEPQISPKIIRGKNMKASQNLN